MVQHGRDRFVVSGECGDRRRRLGVQRHLNGDVDLRVAGETVRSASQLADELPLLIINSSSFDLLTGEPAVRRRLLDWGVFHVEHESRDAFQRFHRALGQRNHLLRRGKLDPIELEVWTRDLAAQGERLARARESSLEALQPRFEKLLKPLAPELVGITLRYRRGWDADLDYAEALERASTSDLEQGFTQSGPQRADLRVHINGHPAAETLSRGQQKLLVTALKLAQGELLLDAGRSVVFLVDDLPSELDEARCERVCRALVEMGAQTLITCIDPASLPVHWFSPAYDADASGLNEGDIAVFHVKHGQVERRLTA
jgi:DNA replication and repair protein RecF